MDFDNFNNFQSLNGTSQYSPPPEFLMSPSSMIMSPNSSTSTSSSNQMGNFNFHYRNDSSQPYLVIREEPIDIFRFRYKSEMSGTHGCLIGRSSKKKFPSVELRNYPNLAKIECTLVQAESNNPHPHRLVVWKDGDEKLEPHECVVGPKENFTASFRGLSILFTGKKHVINELANREVAKNGINFIKNLDYIKNQLERQYENKIKNINLNTVRLKFTAYDLYNQNICEPVFSKTIDNSKSAETAPLKIVNISRAAGSCRGGETVLMFVEKVNKKNIQVIFFELDENESRIWEANATFTELDVHHQYGISFRTPQYRDINIENDVKVYIELCRPKDNVKSEKIKFLYKAHMHQKKRRRIEDGYSNTQYENFSNEIPIPVANFMPNNSFGNVENTNLCEEKNNHSFDISSSVSLFEENEFLLWEELDSMEMYTQLPSSLEFDSPQKICDNDQELLKKVLSSVKKWCAKKDDRKNTEELKKCLCSTAFYNDSLIHLLVKMNSVKILDLILSCLNQLKLDDLINRVNNRGESALHIAAVLENMNIEACNLLMMKGCDPNIQDDFGKTVLHHAIENNNLIFLDNLLSYNKCEYPFGYKLDLNIYDNEGLSPLHQAAKKGSIKIVHSLIEAGASITITSATESKTLLHLCAESGQRDLLQYFLEKNKIEVDKFTLSKNTALDHALFFDGDDAPELCRLLLIHNANPLIRGIKKSPWMKALRRKKIHIIEVMKNFVPMNETYDDMSDSSVDDDSEEFVKVFDENLHFNEFDEEEISSDDSSEYQSILSFEGIYEDAKLLDDLAELLDKSGRWKNLAEELNLMSLLPICQDVINPARIILNDIWMEKRYNGKDLYKLLIKVGADEEALLLSKML